MSTFQIIFTCITIVFEIGAQYPYQHQEYHKNPLIVYVDKTKYVNQGDELQLRCEVENFVDRTISWTLQRQGQPPVILTLGESRITKDSRFNVKLKDNQQNRKSYILHISHIRNDDSGNFTCQISYYNNPIERSIEVYVRTPPVIGEDISRDIKANEGDTIKLMCDATGFPKPRICWKRGDLRPLPNGDAIFCGKELTIHNVTKADRGKYMCIADNDNVQNSLGSLLVRNDMGRSSSNFYAGSEELLPQNRRIVEVKVEFSPTFPHLLNGPKIAVGQAPFRKLDALLECFVEGYPAPKVWWTKLEPSLNDVSDLAKLVKNYYVETYPETHRSNTLSESSINDGKDYNVSLFRDLQDELTVSTLRIIEVQNSDFGFYKCYAENTRGIASLTFTLTESFTPNQIVGGAPVEDYIISAGNDVVSTPLSTTIKFTIATLITVFCSTKQF